MIGLVLHKFTSRKISFINKEKLLTEVRILLRDRHNMNIFLSAPHSPYFLNELINMNYYAMREEEGFNRTSEQSINFLIQKILRKFVEFTIYSDNQIFNLLCLFEFENYTSGTEGAAKDISNELTCTRNFLKLISSVEFVLGEIKNNYLNKPKTPLFDESLPNIEE